ncbi:MAG: protein translocase subunit SecD [Phycisphaeraceae bacterium]
MFDTRRDARRCRRFTTFELRFMGVYDFLVLGYFAALIALVLFYLVRGTWGWRPPFILLVLSACVLLIWYPGRYDPSQQLKPGLDLAGGTTMIYEVAVQEDVENPGRVIDELIDVLRDRIDPAGTRNLVWRQIAGNRIEIQMAMATADTAQRREAYAAAIERIDAGNFSRGQVDAMLRAPDANSRQRQIEQLARGNDSLREALATLAGAHDRLQEAREPYEQVLAAYREAQRELRALPDDADEAQRESAEAQVAELQGDLRDRTEAYYQAREAFERQRGEIERFNVNVQALEDVLSLPTEARRGADQSPREQGVTRLIEQHPDRADAIRAAAEAHAAYQRVRGPLDDPEDLITLLQGAGVLEFRIAATGDTAAGVDIEAYRQQLADRGPRAGADQAWRWFELDDVEQFADTPDELERLHENPARYFASIPPSGMVAAEHGARYYLLLANTPDRSLTRAESGWELTRATREADGRGRPAAGFRLNALGGQLMGHLTGAHVGQPMAILLDNEVISAPVLQDRIRDRGIITGSFSEQEIGYLLRTLRAGSTQAELSERPSMIQTTGPQLGQDNLQAGMRAAVVSLIVVGVFMIGYYFFAGLVANVALLANMIIILGVMSLIDATFTLPGIAGIVLTIGMAVDANVLIFERIREELERKADLATAVRLGYDKALSTILDANLTTLIVCIVLGYTATAEVRGFAVTLGIGILATLFTALFLTRVILQAYVHWARRRSLPMLPTVVPAISRAFSPNVDWIGKRYAFFVLSGVLVLAGVTMVYARGEEMLDIEFRAGTQVNFELAADTTLPIEEVRSRLSTWGQVGAMMQADDFDPGELDARQMAIYQQLAPIAQEARQRRAEKLERGEPVDRELDLGLIAQATVVTVGTTERTDAGTEAGGFNIATLITDQQAVSAMITLIFDDVLDPDLTRTIDFAGGDAERVGGAPVEVVNQPELGEVIGRLDVTGIDVSDYLGGVVVVLEDMAPAPSIEELEQRIRRMRLDPAHEDLSYRPFEVFGLDPAPAAAGDAQRFTSAAVVVRDAETNYIDNPGAFDNPTGLAQTEWVLVRDALQRGTSLGSVSNFSSQISATMQQQAIAAIVLALLAVVAYIWFRFGDIRYGVAAIIALAHDVALAMGLVALTGYFNSESGALGAALLLEPFKINLAIVAAMLTIIGYSLNDTIVVFDRIRENRGKLSRETPAIINESINQTISRTVITSGTTILAVGTLYIFGGPGVHGFAFTVLVGVAVGTYSSIAIAAPILRMFPQRGGPKPDAAETDRARGAERVEHVTG